MPARPRHYWTEAELALVRERYPHEDTKALAAALGVTKQQLSRIANVNGIKKTQAQRSATHRRYCTNNGTAGRFAKGHVPHNKGQSMQVVGRMAETTFQPGNIPHTRAPIGAQRWRKGQWWEKVSEHRAPARKDWRPIAHLLWEAHHGAIPAGLIIVFKNRNPHDLRADNLEAITRPELMRRNSFYRWPKDIQEAMRARSKLLRAIKDSDEPRAASR